MKKNAVVLNARSRIRIASLLPLAGVTILLLGPAAAEARPIGKDGKIHACYRVKGKPKGALRVVRSKRARCRRGERKVSWSVAASSGAAIRTGQQGSHGQDGTSASTSSNEAVLKEQVGTLTKRVEALEGVLLGVTNQDLTGMLATLQGLTNEDLLGAVSAVPAVESLCEQAPELTDQVNELGSGLGGLVAILNGTVLGPIFGSVTIPSALDPFSCPTS